MSGQILRSLKETISFEHPTYIGGGTDIMPLLKNGVRDDCELVFLKKIPELRELTDAGSYLVIGSGMTLTELAENKLVNERCTAVAQAASLTASPQIRNIATIGGNICQPYRYERSVHALGALCGSRTVCAIVSDLWVSCAGARHRLLRILPREFEST